MNRDFDIYIYMYICTYIYIYVCIYIYICIYTCVRICMYVRMYIYLHACVYIFMFTNNIDKQVNIRVRKYLRRTPCSYRLPTTKKKLPPPFWKRIFVHSSTHCEYQLMCRVYNWYTFMLSLLLPNKTAGRIHRKCECGPSIDIRGGLHLRKWMWP